MLKKTILLLICAATVAGLAQGQQPGLPSNKELAAKAKSLYIDSDTFYMKREQLQSSLLGRAEFKAWDLQITGRGDLADLLVHVKRIPFSNHFTYTVTDRRTETIIMAGQEDSLSGTIYCPNGDENGLNKKEFRREPSVVPAA